MDPQPLDFYTLEFGFSLVPLKTNSYLLLASATAKVVGLKPRPRQPSLFTEALRTRSQ